MATDHEFGGQHTDLKLSIVENYLRAFTTALGRRFRHLIYIDAFAGTGFRTVRTPAGEGLLKDHVPARIEQRRGSAKIAIDVEPPFDELIFIERRPRFCTALRGLAAAHPQRSITVVEGEANSELPKLVRRINWRGTRAVLFLDPYGMEVEWATLQVIAQTKAIDLWFLFSLSGLYRQATRSMADMDETKRRAITRMLGTNTWETELYSRPTRLFDVGQAPQRQANVAGLERYVKERLETIFPKVFDPLRLPLRSGPPRYSLFCAISNAEPKAIGLATRIANHILKAGISSKVAPR
jgi:three-Cys-motif partner protein